MTKSVQPFGLQQQLKEITYIHKYTPKTLPSLAVRYKIINLCFKTLPFIETCCHQSWSQAHTNLAGYKILLFTQWRGHFYGLWPDAWEKWTFKKVCGEIILENALLHFIKILFALNLLHFFSWICVLSKLRMALCCI